MTLIQLDIKLPGCIKPCLSLANLFANQTAEAVGVTRIRGFLFTYEILSYPFDFFKKGYNI